MSKENLNSLDDFERFVTSTIKAWPPEKRTALAAAMVDRWLPIYESFSEEYEWGDPQAFEDAVVAVWNCVLGHKLSSNDSKVLFKGVEKNTPHMDDFDCEEVIATSAIVYYALRCCANADNTGDAVLAMESGFEGVAPGIYYDPEQLPPDVWQSPEVQDELDKQLKLLKLIGDMAKVDRQSIEALREKLSSPEFAGNVAPRPEPPKGLTNEEIFERYREEFKGFTDKEIWEDLVRALENTDGKVMPYFRAWAFRYSRRKRAIEERPMLDVVAHDALRTRYLTQDAAIQGDPGWDHGACTTIENGYRIDFEFNFDVHSAEKHHSYGPSLRRLCVERRLAGYGDKDVWEGILDWACQRPPAWDEEDQRKKKGLAYPTPEMGERLSRELNWRTTGDVDHPWATEVAGETWRVGLNDFPDDLMYTLTVDDTVIGKFHDWPESWHR